MNEFVVAKAPKFAGKPPAILSGLVDQKGEFNVEATTRKNDDLILISLVNQEEETVGKEQIYYHENPDGTRGRLNPALKLNVYVMFSGYSGKTVEERYKNSLDMIDWVVRFFQFKHVFTPDTTPGLASGIEKLIVELMSPTFEEQNHLWGALGAKYVPSVIYRVRMLLVREVEASPEAPRIEEIVTTEGPMP